MLMLFWFYAFMVFAFVAKVEIIKFAFTKHFLFKRTELFF